MGKTVLVFVPDSLRLNKSGYLEGARVDYEDSEAFFITSDCVVKDAANVVGYLTDDSAKVRIKNSKAIFIDSQSMKINLINYPTSHDIIRIIYNYQSFRNCDIDAEDQYGIHFKFLNENLRKNHRLNSENGRKTTTIRLLLLITLIMNNSLNFFTKIKSIWLYSATFSHFIDSLTGFQWFFNELISKKQLTPKSGNFILSKIVDLALGILILNFFLENEQFIVNFIEEIRETIIYNFRDLLIYLMGSPIGLKLNHSFNKSLGTFFFYHISLWRIFLITMQPILRQYFKCIVLLGTFGFSYQVAMVSDLVSIATFHVYCIYVYAARLLYFQFKGLFSLWRLFIGRKFNPLRTRVDSHQYSHHQLFIGTLGFTILLFLLPTTTMYYAVFVTFRLIILIVEEILKTIRFLLQSLPLYVLILLLIKSPQVLGPVCLKIKKSKDSIPTFEARLKTLSFFSSLTTFSPNTIEFNSTLSWQKIFTGVLV